MKICHRCGHANDDAAKFCSECAVPLPAVPSDPAQYVPASPQSTYYAQSPVPPQVPNAYGNASVAQNTQKPKKSKKKWIIIAAVALVFIIIIAGSGKKNNRTTPSSAPSTTVSRNAATTAVQNATESKAPTTEATTAASVLTVGSIGIDKGLAITFVSCDTDFKNYRRYATVSDGCKVVRAEFHFENQSDREVSLHNFKCYADNALCDNFYFVDDYKGPALESIGPTRTFDAVVYFEIPRDAVKIDFEYDSYFGDDLLFVVE